MLPPLFCLIFIGATSMYHVTADQNDLELIQATYIILPTTAYNENTSERQHTNCSNDNIESFTVLACGGRSILADGNKGSINTKNGLQASELQLFLIWNAGQLNTIPFVSVVFEDTIIPHNVDLYFHFSPDLRINIPKITLYWSNTDPLDTKNILQFQRMAYQIGSGMYKYKAILEKNHTIPFNYLKIQMEIAGDNWIFLSEIKVYAKKMQVKSSANQINATTMQILSPVSQAVTTNLTKVVQVTSGSSQISTVNPILSTAQITTMLNELLTLNPTSSAAREATSSKFTVATAVALTTTRVTTKTIPSQTIQIISSPQASQSSVIQVLAPSHISGSLSVTSVTDNSVNTTTDVSGSSQTGLPETMIYIAETETKQLSPYITPTNAPNTSTSVPDDIQVMLLYPPNDKTITMTVTQNDASIMLNCTISGPDLAGIDMSWTYNTQPLNNHFTEILNGQKVSYMLAEKPGVYECVARTKNEVMASQIAGTFEIIMSDAESDTPVSTGSEGKPLPTLLIGAVVGVSLVIVLILSIIIVVTTMVIWRKPQNGEDENNRTSTISTKPVKEDEMTYLKFLKANSVPPPSNMSDTMKVKTVSLDNRVSRPSLMLPKTLSKDLDHIHFTFFRSQLEVPANGVDLDMYNDEMYEEINLDIYEHMHSVTVSPTREADFDEYVDMSFRGRSGNSQASGRPFSSIYATPRPLKKHEAPSNVGWDNVRVMTQLGNGIFGEVLLAQITKKMETLHYQNLNKNKEDETTYQSAPIYVVLKVLNTKNLTHKLAFENEIKFMSRLDNDNVIRMLGICNKGTPFIMMEYMENGDLQSYLQKHCYSNDADKNNKIQIGIDVVMYIVLQICSGMKYLAAQNFIHRDLAARNCQVGRLYLTKISDFGISQTLNDSNYYQYNGIDAIPVRWMPTESFYGKFSIKSDVWAFGVTMWEVFHLGRRQPYDHKGDQDVVSDAMKGPSRTLLHKPTQCPYDTYRLMLQCWIHEPQHRPTFEELYLKLYKLYMQYQ